MCSVIEHVKIALNRGRAYVTEMHCRGPKWQLWRCTSVDCGAMQVNFINHFSGCQLCTRQNKEGNYGQCEAEFVKSFEYANGIFTKLLKRMPPRDIAHQMQLAETPYCKVPRHVRIFFRLLFLNRQGNLLPSVTTLHRPVSELI